MYIAQALVSIYEFQDDLQLDCEDLSTAPSGLTAYALIFRLL